MSISPELCRTRAGMTLLEVVLAMAVMAMLAATVFLMVETTMRATVIIQESWTRQQQIDRLTYLCRHTLRNLPRSATITGGVEDVDGKEMPVLTFKNLPGLEVFGSTGQAEEEIPLMGIPRLGGGYPLAVRILTPPPEGGLDEPAEDYITLVQDLAVLEWRFFQTGDEEWRYEWTDEQNRPSLIQLVLMAIEETRTNRATFWIPIRQAVFQESESMPSGGSQNPPKTDRPDTPTTPPGTQQPRQGNQGPPPGR
jgi:prepilin-type N-terminal cleavage/methylation domain-containing protein